MLRTAAVLFAVAAIACLEPEPTEEIGSNQSELTMTNGLTINGIGSNGVLINGFALNGKAPNGVRLQGVRLQGVRLQGVRLQGMTFNGVRLQGVRLQGIGTNGVRLQGVRLQGLEINGIRLQGIRLQGVRLQGVRLQGMDLADATYDGAPLTATQWDNVEVILYHLVGCALRSDQSVTISGTTYHGARGFAPGWRDRQLYKSEEEKIRSCVASAEADLVEPWEVPLESSQYAQIRGLFKYLVSCSLAAGDSVTVEDFTGSSVTYEGGYGLATSWKNGTPTSGELRNVSACLAARTNANGQPVMVSLRGAGIPSDAVEQAGYSWHEGAFWADLFSDDPYMKTCAVQGGGINGRLCTDGACGFDFVGNCADVCDSQGSDDAYTSCGPSNDGNVVNTFLALSTSVSFGDRHNCLKQPDGKVWCWGDNDEGQAGTGSPVPTNIPDPVRAQTPAEVVEITAGYHTTCSRTRSGDVHCWGFNSDGQVGNGTIGGVIATPTRVKNLSGVARVDAGRDMACAVTHAEAGGASKTYCWGRNDYYQLGAVTSSSRSGTPVEVTAVGSGVIDISVGWRPGTHVCAVKDDGDVWCWGKNDKGQLGRGNTGGGTLPGRASLLSGNYTDVCTGASHSCARRDDGSIYCFGGNGNKQTGASSGSATLTPVRAMTGAAPGGLTCGYYHTCALTTGGMVQCWGNDSYGELGNGDITGDKYSPQLVRTVASSSVYLRDVASVEAGLFFNCARKTDDSIYCWGDNAFGQLGDGTTTRRTYAVYNEKASFLPSCGNGICESGESTSSCGDDCCSSGQTRECGGTDVGACQAMTQSCSGGSWGTCTGGVDPATESCDGIDNDCDGLVDEDLVRSCGSDTGVCEAGTETCSGGSWGACEGEVTGDSSETCDDGLDNDCNGQVDDGCCDAAETCGDGIDNDCNGQVDDGCGSTGGSTGGSTAGSCQGSCGGPSPDGCYCDDLCETYGDCCGDYASVCSGGSSQSLCEVGPAQAPASSSCADYICSAMPECCGTGWNSTCVYYAEMFDYYGAWYPACEGTCYTVPAIATGLAPDGYSAVFGPSLPLSWDYDPGVISYEIELYHWNGASWDHQGFHSADVNQVALSVSFSSGYFAFRVRGSNKLGTGSWSAWSYGRLY